MKTGYIEPKSARMEVTSSCTLCDKTNECNVAVHGKPVCYDCLAFIIERSLAAGIIKIEPIKEA